MGGVPPESLNDSRCLRRPQEREVLRVRASSGRQPLCDNLRLPGPTPVFCWGRGSARTRGDLGPGPASSPALPNPEEPLCESGGWTRGQSPAPGVGSSSRPLLAHISAAGTEAGGGGGERTVPKSGGCPLPKVTQRLSPYGRPEAAARDRALQACGFVRTTARDPARGVPPAGPGGGRGQERVLEEKGRRRGFLWRLLPWKRREQKS